MLKWLSDKRVIFGLLVTAAGLSLIAGFPLGIVGIGADGDLNRIDLMILGLVLCIVGAILGDLALKFHDMNFRQD